MRGRSRSDRWVMIIHLDLQENSYDIIVERGALPRAGEFMDLNRRVMIVTDDGVPAGYAATLAKQCADARILTLSQGEASKNLDNFERILSEMLRYGFTRKDCVAAVGGGVVGDLAGFAAACYMRGVDFYNIPTTLLSQVDSSIGGKTAVDLNGVKNVVGAFYQPKAVLIDPDTLKSLDRRQVHAGLAEAIKMAATSDAGLFALIKNSADLEADLEDIIAGALTIKRDVVQKDPREQGLRKILNFGHTIGHAIESCEDGRLLHGECVAAGMLYFSSPQVRSEIKAVLEKYSLPTGTSAGKDELMPYILHDKKMQTGTISVVCVNEIGSFEIRSMTPGEIGALL
mgnify:CR=1 FL=1